MPPTMVLVPAGHLVMGTPLAAIERLQREYQIDHRELFLPETPDHAVYLDAFYIDKYEVTNAQFKAFLDEQPEWYPDRIAPFHHNGDYLKHWQGHDYPPRLADHPVVYVGWYAAVAYAQWAGKRLPTEAEWECAARGGLANTTFPWGNDPATPERVNYAESGFGMTTAVGSYPPNAYGLCDMAGNVWEYCADEWQADYYASSPPANPVAGNCRFTGDEFYRVATRRVIRGGSWGGAPINLRVAYRDSHPPAGAGSHVGFRCARSAAF